MRLHRAALLALPVLAVTVVSAFAGINEDLILAAKRGDLPKVKALLKQNADVAATDRAGVTALGRAAEAGHTEVARLLIEKGAKANEATAKGVTPLMVAAQTGKLDLVRLLLDHGADANARESWRGMTALYSAKTAEIAKLLIDRGADVKGTPGKQTVLSWIAEHGQTDVVRVLLEHKPEASDINNALRLAALYGYKDTVKLLLEHGADVNARDNYGYSALMLTSPTGGRAAIENEKDKKNVAAFVSTKAEIAKLLLEHGADAAAKDNKGGTALYSWANNLELTKLLVERGADVNARTDDHGLTPLMNAAFAGNVEVVRFLVAHGADATATISNGGSAESGVCMEWADKKRPCPRSEILAALAQSTRGGASPTTR